MKEGSSLLLFALMFGLGHIPNRVLVPSMGCIMTLCQCEDIDFWPFKVFFKVFLGKKRFTF